jgi:TonB family protein
MHRVTKTIVAAAAVILLATVIPMRSAWRTPVDDGPVATAPPASRAVIDERRRDVSLLPQSSVPRVDVVLASYAPTEPAGHQVNTSLPATPPRKTVREVKPRYPDEAQRLGIEGSVVLRLTANAAGAVTDTERVNSAMNLRPDEIDADARADYYATNPDAFVIEAERAARAWTFEPAQSSMTVVVSFAFSLGAPAEAGPSTAGPGAAGAPSGLPVLSGRGLPRPGPAPAPTTAPTTTRGGGATKRVTVGGIIRAPLRLVNVNPVYPDAAKAAGIEGIVVLDVVIGENGSVIEARVIRSIPELDQAAIDAVLQWQYEPTLLNGEPVEVEMNVTINFTLR